MRISLGGRNANAELENFGNPATSTLSLLLRRDLELYAPEQPHIYWKTVTAVVTDNDVRRWFAGMHHIRATTTVYNEEYDLNATFTAQGSGMFGAPWETELKKGDKIEVKLYSWVYDSTGEVIKREIHCIERRAENKTF